MDHNKLYEDIAQRTQGDIYIGVVGPVRTGKSTFINQVAKKKSAKAGNRPGVTRGKQWVAVDAGLDLLDTPGIGTYPAAHNAGLPALVRQAGAYILVFGADAPVITESMAAFLATLPLTEKPLLCVLTKADQFSPGQLDAITEYLEKNGIGVPKKNYKLRDWVFSRQRYWGEPIPIVHCPKCGYVPVPEDQLPLELPEVESYMPTDNGESPLAAMRSWVETACPCCGGPAERETDTMPQWAGSSWYFLRYTDPHNDEALASPEALKYWMPVDWYNGGMEHTTLHLLYSRFWHRFLYDQGVVPCPEPYQKRTSHGMILGENGEKMSKSRGNVVNPDDIVNDFGADTLRTYEMFIGAFDLSAAWSQEGVKGCRRFLDRVWKLQELVTDQDSYSKELETKMHQTIKKVGSDIEGLKMNTAIAQLMTLVNALYDNGGATRAEYETLVQLLNPFAPHMTEELWEKLGHTHAQQLAYYPWPSYDEAKCVEATVEIAVQVNGKVKARLTVPADITAEDAIAAAKAEPAVAAALEGKTLVKEIYVKGRLVNLAAKG